MLSDPDTLRVAVLCSRRAPGLADLLVHERDGRYIVAGLVTSETDFTGRPFVEEFGVPWVSRPLRAFHRARGAPLADRDVRAEYDAGTVEVLARFRPDLVLLDGWLFAVTEPLLGAYPGRIYNVHHSDLTAADPRRRYVGLHAVRDALLAGENELRSTLHAVSADVDTGPPVLRSWPLPVPDVVRRARAEGLLTREDVREQEGCLLGDTFGPLLVAAASLTAAGRLVTVAGSAWIDGLPAPFQLERDDTLRWLPPEQELIADPGSFLPVSPRSHAEALP